MNLSCVRPVSEVKEHLLKRNRTKGDFVQGFTSPEINYINSLRLLILLDILLQKGSVQHVIQIVTTILGEA